MTANSLNAHEVWDKPTRLFHWVNVFYVFMLIGFGLIILNASAFGITNDGKILLKTIHVWVGYAFVLNLFFRFYWGFTGNRFARWRQVLPGGPGYMASVLDYASGLFNGRPQHYLGHNPIGRLSVTLIMALLFIQAMTGLFLAGSDIFYPPLGGWIANWIAADGIDPNSLVPYAQEMYDSEAYADMRAIRAPILDTHLYSFYGLVGLIILHIGAVIATEIREGSNLISAMVTGRKIMREDPLDETKPSTENQNQGARKE